MPTSVAERRESPADAVRRWSEELARDPGGRAYLPLADALRQQGELDLALRVALRAVERHAGDADAHDLLARVAVDRGEWERAREEWTAALRLAPAHRPSLKGIGFVHFRAGRFADAESALRHVAAEDAAAASALAHVRRELLAAVAAPAAAAAGPAEARALFAGTVAGADEAALLLDADGLVIAGAFRDAGGRDVAEEIGAQLTGVSEDATRAMRHLGLGAWTSLAIETERAVVTLAPVARGSLLLVSTSAAAPLGYVRRLVASARELADRWLEALG